jgi:hypothetical protein
MLHVVCCPSLQVNIQLRDGRKEYAVLKLTVSSSAHAIDHVPPPPVSPPRSY